jgi:hypothetical protein
LTVVYPQTVHSHTSSATEGLACGGTQLVSFDETILDDRYVLVEAKLRMRFEQEDREPVEALLGSTFVLFDDGDTRRIVFHLESEGIEQALRDRGILRGGS